MSFTYILNSYVEKRMNNTSSYPDSQIHLASCLNKSLSVDHRSSIIKGDIEKYEVEKKQAREAELKRQQIMRDSLREQILQKKLRYESEQRQNQLLEQSCLSKIKQEELRRQEEEMQQFRTRSLEHDMKFSEMMQERQLKKQKIEQEKQRDRQSLQTIKKNILESQMKEFEQKSLYITQQKRLFEEYDLAVEQKKQCEKLLKESDKKAGELYTKYIEDQHFQRNFLSKQQKHRITEAISKKSCFTTTSSKPSPLTEDKLFLKTMIEKERREEALAIKAKQKKKQIEIQRVHYLEQQALDKKRIRDLEAFTKKRELEQLKLSIEQEEELQRQKLLSTYQQNKQTQEILLKQIEERKKKLPLYIT